MQQSFLSSSLLSICAVGIGLVIAIGASVPTYAQDGSPEAEVRSLINDHRAESERCWTGERWRPWPNGADRSLTRSSALDTAAENHNVAMIERNCFGHQCGGEPGLPERVEDAGYPSNWRHISENVAGGFETARAVFNGWRNSASHNLTMLDCRLRAIGIARTNAAQSTYHWYWTADFGDVVDGAQRGNGASDEDDVIATLTTYDANANDRIDRPEFNEIVADWNAGRLSDRVVQKAYDLYRSGEALGGASVRPLLSVSQGQRRATFAVNGLSADQVTVRIYGLSGHLVYAGRTSGPELVWRLQNQQGQPVANGVYLYVIEADTQQGQQRRVGRMTVLP